MLWKCGNPMRDEYKINTQYEPTHHTKHIQYVLIHRKFVCDSDLQHNCFIVSSSLCVSGRVWCVLRPQPMESLLHDKWRLIICIVAGRLCQTNDRNLRCHNIARVCQPHRLAILMLYRAGPPSVGGSISTTIIRCKFLVTQISYYTRMHLFTLRWLCCVCVCVQLLNAKCQNADGFRCCFWSANNCISLFWRWPQRTMCHKIPASNAISPHKILTWNALRLGRNAASICIGNKAQASRRNKSEKHINSFSN